MNARRLLLFVSLGLSMCGHLHGASRYTFRVVGVNVTVEGLHYAYDGKDVSVRLTEQGFSPRYEATRGTPLDFYRLSQHDGVLTRQIVMPIAPPSGESDQWLLLIEKNKFPGADAYRPLWVDDSLKAHPAGTVIVYNFSGVPLAYRMVDAQGEMAPRTTVLRPFLASDRQLPFRLASLRQGQWKLAMATQIPVRRNYRVHAIIREGTSEDLVINGYLDMLLAHDYVPSAP